MAEFFLNDFIVNVDVAIYQFVDSIMNPVLDVIMTFITHLGDTPGIRLACASVSGLIAVSFCRASVDSDSILL